MINADTPTIPVRYKSRMNLMMNFGIIVFTSALLLVFAGVIFGPTLKTAFATTGQTANNPVSDGLASYAVKQNVWAVIVTYEQALGCSSPVSTSIAITRRPDASGTWTEGWAVNACGTAQIFKVRFTPDSNNSITFSISK